MLTHTLQAFVLTALLAVFSLAPVYASGPVPVDDLPEAVSSAVLERFDGAELLQAEMSTDNDMVEYDVTFRHEGQLYEATIIEDGTIIDLEQK